MMISFPGSISHLSISVIRILPIPGEWKPRGFTTTSCQTENPTRSSGSTNYWAGILLSPALSMSCPRSGPRPCGDRQKRPSPKIAVSFIPQFNR